MDSESSTGGTGLVRERLESPGGTVETMPVVVKGWLLHSTQEPAGIMQARMTWLGVTRMMADIIRCWRYWMDTLGNVWLFKWPGSSHRSRYRSVWLICV